MLVCASVCICVRVYCVCIEKEQMHWLLTQARLKNGNVVATNGRHPKRHDIQSNKSERASDRERELCVRQYVRKGNDWMGQRGLFHEINNIWIQYYENRKNAQQDLVQWLIYGPKRNTFWINAAMRLLCSCLSVCGIGPLHFHEKWYILTFAWFARRNKQILVIIIKKKANKWCVGFVVCCCSSLGSASAVWLHDLCGVSCVRIWMRPICGRIGNNQGAILFMLDTNDAHSSYSAGIDSITMLPFTRHDICLPSAGWKESEHIFCWLLTCIFVCCFSFQALRIESITVQLIVIREARWITSALLWTLLLLRLVPAAGIQPHSACMRGPNIKNWAKMLYLFTACKHMEGIIAYSGN